MAEAKKSATKKKAAEKVVEVPDLLVACADLKTRIEAEKELYAHNIVGGRLVQVARAISNVQDAAWVAAQTER